MLPYWADKGLFVSLIFNYLPTYLETKITLSYFGCVVGDKKKSDFKLKAPLTKKYFKKKNILID